MIELDILHSIKPIEVEGGIYSPHKGEEGVTVPDKLGKAMIKRGWAKKAHVTYCKVKGAELKAVAQWLKNTLTISGSRIGDNGITTHFVDATNIYGGKVFTPAEWISRKDKCVFAFDSHRLTKCLWTCKKGEEINIRIRPSTLDIRDKDGRQWTHKLPTKEEMKYIKDIKKIKTGSIKCFFSKEQLKTLKNAIAEAVKEGKGDYTNYEDIVFLTEGKDVVVYIHGFGDIKRVYCVYTGDERGESVAVYSLDMFLEVLKGVKPRGKTEGLKLIYDEDKALKATFKIGASTAVVYIVGKIEERREEVRKALNLSSPTAEEETNKDKWIKEEVAKDNLVIGKNDTEESAEVKELKDSIKIDEETLAKAENEEEDLEPKAGEEEIFNADVPRMEEDIKQAKAELDKIQEQEKIEHEKYLARINKAATDAAEQVEREKTEAAFKETEKSVKEWEATYKETTHKEIRGDVSFLTVHEATGAQFTSSEDVYKDMKAEAEIDRECMWVLHLDVSNKVVLKEMVAMGRGNSAQIAPREVYRRAIIEGAVVVILVHNHPSGDPAPSEKDKICSENMKKAGMLLGVPLLDFMIVAKQGYRSFADKGIGGF